MLSPSLLHFAANSLPRKRKIHHKIEQTTFNLHKVLYKTSDFRLVAATSQHGEESTAE